MATSSHSWLNPALRMQTRGAALLLAVFCAAAAVGVRFGMAAQLAILLGGMVLVGVPHGAFDHLVARPVLSPRLGPAWWVPFGAGYFGLAALVGLAWWVAPAWTLAGFLAGSIVHFGLGDAEDGLAPRAVPRWAAVLVYGATPVLLPIALHPDMAAPVLAGLADVSVPAMVAALRPAAWLLPVWAVAFAWVLWAAYREGLGVAERLLTAAAFVMLPPLLAFGLYFTAGHAMRHVLRLGAWYAPTDGRRAVRWLLRTIVPWAIGTAVAGVALAWRGDDLTAAVLVPAFRAIAALTLPHMLVTAWLGETDTSAQRMSAVVASPTGSRPVATPTLP